MYLFGKNNNHLIKNNYKATFSLPQKVKGFTKPIIKCACGSDFVICLTEDFKTYCYFQSGIHSVQFKKDIMIVDIGLEENLIFFVTQQGELYASEFLAQKLANDGLKPKLIKLTLPFSSSKQKIIKNVFMSTGNIFLKMQNNQILHFRKNDWMQTKSFSDPKLVLASKSSDILQIKSFKDSYYFLTKQGNLFSSSQSQLSVNFKRIDLKDKLRKIDSNNKQLFAINQSGDIIRIQINSNKGKTQRVWKISNKFIDLSVGQENYYAITQNQQAWVWGKNSHGQLGLSDYEPRISLYPLVSLQDFVIKNIFVGQNYVICNVDGSKKRNQVQQKPKQSVKSSYRQMRSFSTQNNFIQCKDSLNQTDQFLMPIRYTEEQSKDSLTDHNKSISEINKERSNLKEKQNLFRKSIIKNAKKSNQRQSFKSSTKNQNVCSKLIKRKIQELSDRKSCNKSVRSHSKSFISNSKSNISNSKITQKSMIGDKSPQRMQKIKSQLKNPFKQYETNKSCQKSHKRQYIVSYKHSDKDFQSLDIHKGCKENLQRQIIEKERKQKQNLNALSEAFKLQKQKLKIVIASLENEYKNKVDENKDLYALLSEKNAIISDITQKIQLLQSAIEQHEKALTARDNEAQQFYLREKEYQLHIEKLQNQVQKMMQILNHNERNKQSETYKKEMERMSLEVKSKIDNEKQYYKERIACLQKKFDEQRNIYQLEIRKLHQQVSSLKYQNNSLFSKVNNKQNLGSKFLINTSGLENNASNCIQSPTFHTLDMKNNLKRPLEGKYLLNQSQVTLQDHVNQIQVMPLQQSNRENLNFTQLQGKYQQNSITKKNSRTNNFFSKPDFDNQQNNFQDKSQSEVKEILSKIEVTKSYISKSANKLYNILENQKAD